MATAIGRRHRLAARCLQGHAVGEGVYAVVPGYEGVIPRQQRLSIRTGELHRARVVGHGIVELIERSHCNVECRTCRAARRSRYQ